MCFSMGNFIIVVHTYSVSDNEQSYQIFLSHMYRQYIPTLFAHYITLLTFKTHHVRSILLKLHKKLDLIWLWNKIQDLRPINLKSNDNYTNDNKLHVLEKSFTEEN